LSLKGKKILRKITHGYVIQNFDEHAKKFVSQEFMIGDDPEYEDLFG